MSVPASGPMMCAPRIRSLALSARIFTNPSVSPIARARPLAVNGNLPTAFERALLLVVHRQHDAVGELDDRDVRAEPPPNAAEFQPDIAAPGHDEMGRNRIQLEAARRRDDLLFVHLHARKRHALAAGRYD